MQNNGHVQIKKYFLKIEHLRIKMIEMIPILITEASPSRAIFSQIISELEGKTQGAEM